MKKTILLHNHGWSYVETVMSIAVLAIIVISVSMVISMSSKIGVTYKKKVQAHQFAQSIIEDLRRRSGENFIGVRDSTITYNAFMNGGSGSSDMVAYLDITMKEGTKKVDINISWTDANGRNKTTYSTQISPRGSFDGGIAKGKVLYIAYLDSDHRIPTGLGGPDEIYLEAKKEYYAGAGGVTVKALGNNDDGGYVITKTDDNGEFVLNNIKVNVNPLTNTTIYFYKEGSYPTDYLSQFEQAYYFFDKGTDLPNGADNPYNQRGLYTKQVSFPKSGHEEDIGVIVCAKAWDFYVQVKIEGVNIYRYNYGYVKVLGDFLRWGVHDSFVNDSFETDRNYWSVYAKVLSTRTFTDRGVVYNICLRNLRGAYVQSEGVSHIPLTFEFGRYIGSKPDVPTVNVTRTNDLINNPLHSFYYSTFESSHTISFNPVNNNFFGNSSGISHLIAPLSAELSGFPMKEHTQDFHNTLNLIVEEDNELINPRMVELTRFGWLSGTVEDEEGNPLSGMLVGYYTAHDVPKRMDMGYYTHDYDGTRKNYYTFTDDEGKYDRVDESSIIGESCSLSNVIGELEGVSFSNISVEHDYLYAYGEVDGIRYYGLPETVNGFGYDDIDALALVDQENIVDFVVYPGVNVSGEIETVSGQSPAPQFEVYMREVLGWNTTISVISGSAFGGPVSKYSFAGNNIKRSVHDQNLPIGVRSIDPAVGVPVIFDITVEDEDGDPVEDAIVTVTQHLFDGAEWQVEWDATGDVNQITDNNGQVNDNNMSLPLTHERWTVICKTDAAIVVDLTQAEGHKVDDGHAMFSWVRVTHVDYEPINVWFDAAWGLSQPVDPEGLLPNTTISRTINLTEKETVDEIVDKTITFTLTFSHKDDLNDPPALIPVDTIVIKDGDHFEEHVDSWGMIVPRYPYHAYDVSGSSSYTFTLKMCRQHKRESFNTSPPTHIYVPYDYGQYIIIHSVKSNTIGGMKYNFKTVRLTEKHNNRTIHIKIGYESGS